MLDRTALITVLLRDSPMCVDWTPRHTRVSRPLEGGAQVAGPDSPVLNTGETYSYTYDAVGIFDYHCRIHPTVKGSVTVTAQGTRLGLDGHMEKMTQGVAGAAKAVAGTSVILKTGRRSGGKRSRFLQCDRSISANGRRSRPCARARAGQLSGRPAYQDGFRTRTARGGNVSATECGCPCHGLGSAHAPPSFPRLLPLYSPASLLISSR